MSRLFIKNNNLPFAVILGLTDTGYGVVRSLSLFNVPMIAYEINSSRPEVRTKLCEVEIYKDEVDLLERLVRLTADLNHVPALFVTSDSLVRFCMKNKRILKQHFRMDLPSVRTIRILLEKNEFSDFAVKEGFKIPKTFTIQSRNDFDACLNQLSFPCVIKPYWRNENWKKAKYPKIFVFSKINRLLRNFDYIFTVENNLIIQEWIPGTDADIFFSLVYYNNDSNCISEFTGRKLRQWPVGTGSTTCAIPADEQVVKSETMRLFDLVSYSGFGSVEFKRHSLTGDFYIMEPTVGRPNLQSFLATANGVNMPVMAYSALTGAGVKSSRTSNSQSAWIDDQFDLLSIVGNTLKGHCNIIDIYKPYSSKKSFRFLNRNDMGPFLHALFSGPKKGFLRVIHYLKRQLKK